MDASYDLHFDFDADGGADFFKNVSTFIASLDELNVAICSYVDSEINNPRYFRGRRKWLAKSKSKRHIKKHR